jgi:hypothetical protein
MIFAQQQGQPSQGPAVDPIVPNPAPQAPPGVGGTADMVLGWMKWVAIVCVVAGLFWCAVQMGIGRRNRSQMAVEGALGIPWAGLALTVVGAAPLLVSAFL